MKTSKSIRRLVALAAYCAASLAFVQSPRSQEAETPAETKAETPVVEEVIPLIERGPFDIIKLNEANWNFQAEVEPILTIPRPSVPAGQRKGMLQFRFLDDITLLYEVGWEHVVDVITFEKMLFDEANLFVKAKDFDGAYRNFMRLTREYEGYPGLDPAINNCLYRDAAELFRASRYAESLSVMEVLHERDNNYPRPGQLKAAMGQLVDKIVEDYIEKTEFRSARLILDRLDKKYGNEKPETIQKLRRTLTTLAQEKLKLAQENFDNKQYREAIEFIHEALDISPAVPGAQALERTLSETFPQIFVGVTQPALSYDSGRIDNWAARRTGRLVHQNLIEFLGAGSEGGEYQFPGGLIERSPDGRIMTFRLSQFGDDPSQPIQSGFDLARRLLQLSNPRSAEYRVGWGGLMTGVVVDDVLKVDVDLRRSHVLPESLLRVPASGSVTEDGAQATSGNGSFNADKLGETETRFVEKSFTPGSRLAELVEVRFENANAALNALRRGRIDVIDRLFPSDAARLQERLGSDSELVVQQYALPTVHMLIPQSDHPFLASSKFRRALLFGINRQTILNQELLGGKELPGCKVISGPFPAGIDQSDPLGYAYDHSIDPRVWRPRLAKLLTIFAENDLASKAERTDEVPPKLTPLVLAHPANEAARVASQAIKAYLDVIGIEINVKELPPGASMDPDNEADLLYTEIAIWEPVADARKLLGPAGVASSDNPFLNQALRRLDSAENWGTVRDQLVALHQIAHNDVTVIPLWQTTDFFVYNKRIKNIGEQPVWLYQSIDQWRISVQQTAKR
jgi:tetratricopeptide (TPR) repeat protein